MTAKIIMFPNNYKEKDSQPDLKSHSEGFTPEEDIIIRAGEKYDIAGWNNISKSGKPYLTLIVSPFKERKPKAGNDAPDDDIPF